MYAFSAPLSAVTPHATAFGSHRDTASLQKVPQSSRGFTAEACSPSLDRMSAAAGPPSAAGTGGASRSDTYFGVDRDKQAKVVATKPWLTECVPLPLRACDARGPRYSRNDLALQSTVSTTRHRCFTSPSRAALQSQVLQARARCWRGGDENGARARDADMGAWRCLDGLDMQSNRTSRQAGHRSRRGACDTPAHFACNGRHTPHHAHADARAVRVATRPPVRCFSPAH